MQILYFFEDKNTLMDKWQQFHIFDELEKHDCHIIVFNPLEYSSIDKANEKLIKYIQRNRFDLFMTPYGHDHFFVDTLNYLKKVGIPTLLICFDNLLIPFKHKKIAKYFDLVWLTSRETEDLFKKWGANIIFNPYAANPYFFKPQFETEIERVAFVGTPYGSRANMINALTENRIDTTLFTKESSMQNICKQSMKDYIHPACDLIRFDIGRRIILGAIKQKILKNTTLNTNNKYLEIKFPVEFNQLSRLYSNYAVSLSSTAARNTGVLNKPINVVNLRSFEIPMSGGLQICSYFDELAEYYEEDKEIIFYRSQEEFLEKVRFYLKSENNNLRMKMKKAARRRAENEHTWFCRFKKVFDYFGLEYE